MSAETFPVWTDWRGNPYTVGSLVLYPRLSGRSCEMAEGYVTDLFEVYRGDNYDWTRLAPGEAAPCHEVWKYRNPETGEVIQWHRDSYERIQVTEPRETEKRVKIMPTGRTSRFGGYWNKRWDRDAREFVDTGQKPVTLTKNVESVTVIREEG